MVRRLAHHIDSHIVTSILVSQILFTSDPEIEAEALLSLESFLRTLYPSPDSKPTGLIADIVHQCLDILKEPEKSKAKPATKIIASCFKASRTCLVPCVFQFWFVSALKCSLAVPF